VRRYLPSVVAVRKVYGRVNVRSSLAASVWRWSWTDPGTGPPSGQGWPDLSQSDHRRATRVSRLLSGMSMHEGRRWVVSLGDHLWVQRPMYRHHGVDLGDGQVVHYTGSITRPGAISITSAEVFTQGAPFHMVHHERRLSVEETVHRAKSRVGENNYRFIDSNCEHFATWAVTGLHNSEQVLTVVGTLNRGPGTFLGRMESTKRQKGQELNDAPRWCSVCLAEHGWPPVAASRPWDGEHAAARSTRRVAIFTGRRHGR